MAVDYRAITVSVKTAYDISDYIMSTGVTLKPEGVGKWKGLCPFHSEKTPSFNVNDNFQNYKCWGCGVSGDILSYVSAKENLSFVETLKKLADEKGIAFDTSEDASITDYSSLRKIVRHAALFYCKAFDVLPENHAAKVEITKRGLTFENSSPTSLKYGYSPTGNRLYASLKKAGFSDELILETGLVRQNSTSGEYFDFFRSRLMFVFTDRYGKPIGFSSRKLFEDDKRGKYVNSSESPLFHKSQVLYNHALARKTANDGKTVFVTEGQFDVAALVESGLPNVVAASGTAFTRQHLEECKRLAGDNGRVVFCLDGDEAGAKAALKIFSNIPESHDCGYVVTLPEDLDPCDYRLQFGSEALNERLSNAIPLVEFVLSQMQHEYGCNTSVERSNYVQATSSILKSIQNAALRENCIKIVSLNSSTPIDVVRASVAKASPLKSSSSATPRTPERIDPPSDNDENESVVDSEEEETESSETDEQVRERLITLMEDDLLYSAASKFVSLGLTHKGWWPSLIRSRNLLPDEFRPFIDELDGMKENVSKVFPELFENALIADVLMSRDFSPFSKTMDMRELKELYIHLHSTLQEFHDDGVREDRSHHVQKMLASAEETDLEFLKSLLVKEGVICT